ncbi:class I SAM-dependent methyltransferase [Halorhabdus amylolytica]|uniref:class I SAM-dependent methyltransferase n=1 Tax=Halorhabdus amylolytica TaxID=2559573 RepID=UPI0010A99C85|nr:class I SAM-dependent methyltransferase [Halorhabdus amylolytica]
MDVPATVRTALADRPVEGRRCLEAGAGAGNAAAGLLDAGAADVLAVTNDREHARTVRERVGTDHPGRVGVFEADLRSIPLPDDSVAVVTAHALFNVVPTTDLDVIASEITRVAAPGAHLLVDDYAPLPDGASIRDLFALENAARELADARPALTFYPGGVLRGVFETRGWEFDRRKTLLDPVPWTESHVTAHADTVRDAAARIDGDLRNVLVNRTDSLVTEIGSESVGEMYSLAFQLPE